MDELKKRFEDWKSNVTSSETEWNELEVELINHLNEHQYQMTVDLDYLLKDNPEVNFSKFIEKYNLDPDKSWTFPGYGHELLNIDENICKIIRDFNPKYLAWIGEDSLVQQLNIQEGERVYRWTDFHEPDIDNKFTVGPQIYRHGDQILRVSQFTPVANISFCLIKDDIAIATLLDLDPWVGPGQMKNINLNLISKIFKLYKF